MAFTQLTLPLKQLYNLCRIYNPVNSKQIYTRAEYVLWDDVCNLFHSFSLIIFSTSEILVETWHIVFEACIHIYSTNVKLHI